MFLISRNTFQNTAFVGQTSDKLEAHDNYKLLRFICYTLRGLLSMKEQITKGKEKRNYVNGRRERD